MSRVWIGVRSAYLPRVVRLWKDRGHLLNTFDKAENNQLAVIAPTVTGGDLPSTGCKGQGSLDEIVYGIAQQRELRNVHLHQITSAQIGGTVCVQGDPVGGWWVRDGALPRAFSSEALPKNGVEEVKIEEPHAVETKAVEASPEEGRVDLGKSEASILLEEVLGEEEEPDVESLEEEEGTKGTKGFTGLWKKIEKAKQGSVVPLINQWLAEGNTLNKSTLITSLVRLRRRTRYRQAMEISDWLAQEKDMKWEAIDNITRIDLKAKMRQFGVAEQLFENSPPEFKNELAYHTLLKNYVDFRMSDKAEALMAKLSESGLLTLPFAFNQMLLLYKRKDLEDRIPRVLDQMKGAGIARDSYTYNILMDMKARNGDVPGMEQIFEELMADQGVKPDAATYGTLATAYVHAGQLDKARDYLKKMEEGPFDRKRQTYDILMAQYGTIGDADGVERVWEKIKSFPVVSNRSYVTAIEAFGKLGNVERGEQIYGEMEKEKGLVLTRQFNAMLSVYTRQGMADKAEKLIEQMVKTGRKRNAITFHHLVIGYLKNDQLDKALEALQQAKGDTTHSRTKPWIETRLAILDAYAQKGNVVGAEKHFQDLKKAYPKIDTRVYNILLKTYVSAQVPAGGFLQRMEADNVLPNEATYRLLEQQSRQHLVPLEGADTGEDARQQDASTVV